MKNIFISVLTMTCLFVLPGVMSTVYAAPRVVNLQVDGMTTPTCPSLLKSAVKNIEGVKSVDASLENRRATIEFDEDKISLEQIQERIESSVGFRTRVE